MWEISICWKAAATLSDVTNLGINLLHNFEQPLAKRQLCELCNKQARCKRGSSMSDRLSYTKLTSILTSLSRSAASRAFTHWWRHHHHLLYAWCVCVCSSSKLTHTVIKAQYFLSSGQTTFEPQSSLILDILEFFLNLGPSAAEWLYSCNNPSFHTVKYFMEYFTVWILRRNTK